MFRTAYQEIVELMQGFLASQPEEMTLRIKVSRIISTYPHETDHVHGFPIAQSVVEISTDAFSWLLLSKLHVNRGNTSASEIIAIARETYLSPDF